MRPNSVVQPYKEHWEPQIVKFKDELSGVIFKSSVVRVKKAGYKATQLMQETNFVSLEEYYSFLGISDAVKLFSPHIDITYGDLSNVLGWDLMDGYRIIEPNLVPEIIDKEVIINIIFDETPYFHDVTGYLSPNEISDYISRKGVESLPPDFIYSHTDFWEPIKELSWTNTLNYVERRNDI